MHYIPHDRFIHVDDDTRSLLASIKQLRINLGLSQRKLAALIHIPQSTLGHYERGDNFPCLRHFLKLAAFFHWDISNNINFLFMAHKDNLRYFRRFKLSQGFSNSEIQRIIALNESSIADFFNGNGNIHVFAEISQLFNEEHRLVKFRQYLLRKKD